MSSRIVANRLGTLGNGQQLSPDAASLHVYDTDAQAERRRYAGQFGEQVGETVPVAEDATDVEIQCARAGYLHMVLWEAGTPLVWFEPAMVGFGSAVRIAPLPLVVTLS